MLTPSYTTVSTVYIYVHSYNVFKAYTYYFAVAIVLSIPHIKVVLSAFALEGNPIPKDYTRSGVTVPSGNRLPVVG